MATASATPPTAFVHRLAVEDNPKYNIPCDALGTPLIILHSVPDDNPLNKVTEKEAVRFHRKYQLQVEQDVFVRGVIALRSQVDIKAEFEVIQELRSKEPNVPHNPIELRVGEHRYTRLESEILYKDFLPQSRKETLGSLSRLHRLLIVACIYAAMTQ
jgi:hypothetical protein